MKRLWLVSLLCVPALLLLALTACAPVPAVPQRAITAPLMRTPPPCIYAFWDLGTDFATSHPEYGAIGSFHSVFWEEINPAPGVFDFSLPDRRLATEARLRVTLRDGTVIPKPVMLQVLVTTTQNKLAACTGSQWYDGTPQWLYQQIERELGVPLPRQCGRRTGHLLTCGSKTAAVPMYDNVTWRSAFADMVAALGQHYNDNKQIAAIVIGTGLDGETISTKNDTCDWGKALAEQAGGVSYRFQQWIIESMRTYRAAFPSIPVFVQNAPGGGGIRSATAKEAASSGVGMKNNSLWVDHQNHQGIGAEIGMWDKYAVLSDTVPLAAESVFGMGNPEIRYWSYLMALHYHIDVLDLHPEWLPDSRPQDLLFIQSLLGQRPNSAPMVWTALRDYEFAPISWGSAGQSGKQGDWTYWLYRTSDNTRVMRADLPQAAQASIYSRQARVVDPDHPLTVVVDPAVWFAGQPVRVTVTSYGPVTCGHEMGTVSDAGDGWIHTTFDISCAAISIESPGAYVHMVRVEPVGTAPTPTIAPTIAPTAIPTATPTLCNSPTPTLTLAPPSVTPVTLPSVTPTCTPTPEPIPLDIPTVGEALRNCWASVWLLVLAIGMWIVGRRRREGR